MPETFDPLPEKIGADPKFLALSPEAQAIVRKKYADKFAALSPDAQEIVKAKRAPARPTQMLDERGQPLPRALPEGTVEDLEETLPTERVGLFKALGTPSPTLVKAAQDIENPYLGGAAELGAEMMTPVNAALGGGLAKAAPAVAQAASGAFTVETMKMIAHVAPEAYEAFQRGDTDQGIRLTVKAGLAGLLSVPLVRHVAGAFRREKPQMGPTREDYWPSREGEAVPPTEAARGRVPERVPDFWAEEMDPAKVGNQPFPEGPAPPRARGLEQLSLDPDAPIPVEAVPPGRGPRPPLEPAEVVPRAEYPGPSGPRQELIPEELIGQPETPIDPETAGVYAPERIPRQEAPAQDIFHPEPEVQPRSAIGTEIGRQEAKLEGQQAAAKELRKALQDSESALAIEKEALETEASIRELKQMFDQHEAQRQPPTIPNPPAHPVLEAALAEELAMRGLNPSDPQAVMDLVARHSNLRKPADVITVGTYPVSRSIETPNRYEADLTQGKPSTVLHEGKHMVNAEGGPQVPEGMGANDSIVAEFLQKNRLSRDVTTVNAHLERVAAGVADSPIREAINLDPMQVQRVAERGTVSKELREASREGGEKPETKALRVSELDVRDINAKFVEAARAADEAGRVAGELERVAAERGDRGSRSAAALANRQAKAAYDMAVDYHKQIVTTKFAAGRTVRAFDMPPELAAEIGRTGRMLMAERSRRLQAPIWDDIINTVAAYKTKQLSLGEATKQIAGDVTFQIGTNLFTYFSALLDTAANATELTSQVVGSMGADLGHVSQGRFDFPNTRAWGYAFADRVTRAPIHPEIEQMLQHKTAMGVDVRAGFRGERGAFLYRTTPVRKALDYAQGIPAYMKGAVDRAAGNLASSAALWSEAMRSTPEGMSPMEARAWRHRFIENPPADSLQVAVSAGQKAKFDRPLTTIEENLVASTPYRLLVDIFARWPQQFVRGFAEWFGANPEFWKEFKKGGGSMRADQWGRYLSKSMVGPAAVYLIGNNIYDDMDFRSMDYVTLNPNGTEKERTRLAMAPIPEILMTTALLKAAAEPSQAQKHLEKARATLQFVSIPGAKVANWLLFGGEPGGILSAVIGHSRADKNRAVDPAGAQRTVIDQLNRLLPIQATTSILKYIVDPLEREGMGARLPFLSQALPYRPSTTQGGPMQRRRQLPGGAGEVVTAANVPGSTRELDPVEGLLMKYGLPVYRGPRAVGVGVPGAEVELKILKDAIQSSKTGEALPTQDEIRRAWEEEVGLARQQILNPLIHRLRLQGNDLEKMGYETGRNLVQRLDAKAVKIATKSVLARFGGTVKPFRRETLKELTGPEALHADYEAAKAEFEAAQAQALGLK